MNRKEFLKVIPFLPIAASSMSFESIKKLADSAPETPTMPVFFIGHGSPMNGIEHNYYTLHWAEEAQKIPTPNAVICISAHWLTRGTKMTAMTQPGTIYDFGGFPEALYQVKYPAPGDPALVKETASLVKLTPIEADHEWGLDHGTWTIVRHMYPSAQIPVLQLSIDYTKPMAWHYELARELYMLRKKGVLIIGSGNMVHNLGMVAWDKLNEESYGYDWAIEINNTFKKLIAEGDHAALISYEKLGKAARLAIPGPDHYIPLLYTLGLTRQNEIPYFFNDKVVAGSLTMTSVKFG